MPTAGPTVFANGKNLAAACGNLALTEGKNLAHTAGVNFTSWFMVVVYLSEEIFIRKIPLPFGVRAFTLPDSQGDYNVYINEKLSYDQQVRSLQHEKEHILNGDFLKDETACEIEQIALMRLLSK